MKRKIFFFIQWVLLNGIGGAIGLLLAEQVIQILVVNNSEFIGIIVFEICVLLFKHISFHRFKDFFAAKIIDNISWVFAGITVLVGEFAQNSSYNEEVTSISFNVVRFSALFIIGIVLLLQIFRFKNHIDIMKLKIKNWDSHLREYADERLFGSLLTTLFYLFIYLTFIAIFSIVLFFYFAVLLILVIGPIEYIKIAVSQLATPEKIIWFGFYSLSYTGFITGLIYIIFLKPITIKRGVINRGYKYWRKK